MIDVVELARELAARMSPDALLDAQDAAAVLGCSERYFKDRYAPAAGFPRPVRLTTTEGRSHPKWQRSDLMGWIEMHKRTSARGGRPRKTPSGQALSRDAGSLAAERAASAT